MMMGPWIGLCEARSNVASETDTEAASETRMASVDTA